MNPRTLTPSISLLLAFEASARHRSFTRAASELSLTQSAVSRQVQTLEALLEVELFSRQGRQIELTDAGRMYAREVGAAIGRIRNATLQALAFRGGGGNFNLAVLPTFSAKWLMPRLHLFYANHPDVIIHMHTRIGVFDLDLAGVDAVIGVGSDPWPGLVSHTLLDEELLLVASPGLCAKKPIRTPRDLADVLLLRVATRPNAWQEWLAAQGSEHRSACFGPMFELTSHLIQAVATGIGVGLVPRCMVEDELETGKLVVPMGQPYSTGYRYLFAYPAHKAELPPLVSFRDWLLAAS